MLVFVLLTVVAAVEAAEPIALPPQLLAAAPPIGMIPDPNMLTSATLANFTQFMVTQLQERAGACIDDP